MQHKKRKVWIRDMAAQRIRQLFEMADEIFKQDPMMSKRYVYLARRMGMRHRVRIPAELKRRVCKECGAYLVPGANCRVRIKNNMIITMCMDCGRLMRKPYSKTGQ